MARTKSAPSSDKEDRLTRLKQIHAKAKVLRDPHVSELRDCFLYTLPARQCFRKEPGTITDRSRLYDSTATAAALNLVTLTNRLLIPQDSVWCGIELRDSLKRKAFQDRPVPLEVTRALVDFNNLLFEAFSHSNFYLAVDEALSDAIICGTGALACYAGDNWDACGIEFKAVHPESLLFVESASGNIDIVFRTHKMTARQLVQRWGAEKLPQEIAQDEERNPEATHEVCEIEQPLGDDTFAYSVHLSGHGWDEIEYTECSFRTFTVFRWSKSSHEVWGESQVRHALPSIRSLNRLAELIEAHGEMASLGLWQNTDTASDMSKLKGLLEAGSIINVDQPLQPLEFPGDFKISETMLGDLRAQVKTLLFDSPLPSTAQNNYMTSTEVQARLQIYFQQVGGPALRLEQELLRPIVEQVSKRLVAFGYLPKPTPQFLQAIGAPPDAKIDDVFTPTVTSAVKLVLRRNRAQTNLQAVGSVLQVMGPAIVFKQVDQDQLTRDLLLDMGLDPSELRTPQAVAALEKQNQQLQAAQMALNAGQQLADIQSKAGQGQPQQPQQQQQPSNVNSAPSLPQAA